VVKKKGYDITVIEHIQVNPLPKINYDFINYLKKAKKILRKRKEF